MQDELRREVLDYSRRFSVNDLGRVRIASKALHEAMMGYDLDLSCYWGSVDEPMALGHGIAFHKFKKVPAEQRSSCVAGRVLDHLRAGKELSIGGWNAVPDLSRRHIDLDSRKANLQPSQRVCQVHVAQQLSPFLQG